MAESDLVRRILNRLRTEYPCGTWYKIHTGPFQERGIPDIIGCYQGLYIAMEVKTLENRKGLSEYQKLQRDKIIKSGGIFWEARSVKEALGFMGVRFKHSQKSSL